MKKKIIFLSCALFFCCFIFKTEAQSVGIGTPAPENSAMLEVKSSNKGMLIPRTSTASRIAIVNPAKGLVLYDSTTNSFWFHNGSAWTEIAAGGSGWNLTGNSSTNPSTNFMGTTDNTDLRFKIHNANAGYLSNSGNIFWGLRSGNANTTGYSNIAIGTDALKSNTDGFNLVAIGDSALFYNGTGALANFNEGAENTAVGSKALYQNNKGTRNSAFGTRALYWNTIGQYNDASGYAALYNNSTGNFNTASGVEALYTNSIGSTNTAVGYSSLYANSSGSGNTAIGALALVSQNFSNSNFSWESGNTAVGYSSLASNNPTNVNNGIYNTAIGNSALLYNSIGKYNTATGYAALYSNTIGISNTANGYASMYKNTSGINNTASGQGALYSNTLASSNTAFGYAALALNTTCEENTAIGVSSLYNQSFDFNGLLATTANTAIGFESLYSNQPNAFGGGFFNTAIGHSTMRANTVGSDNTAIGNGALQSNTYGHHNIAIGNDALNSNTGASQNLAIGVGALGLQAFNNGGTTWESQNIAIGYQALYSNQPSLSTNGKENTGTGFQAMKQNTTGYQNSAYGHSALLNNTTGLSNTSGGYASMFSNTYGSYNTAYGQGALYNVNGGQGNIGIGYGAGTAAGSPVTNNTISIGNNDILNAASNQAFIGNTSMTFIGGKVTWSTYSDARIKNTIEEDVKGLDFISKLRPVTYHISNKAIVQLTGNKEGPDFPEKYDGEKIKYSGFLAQEVEQAAKDAGYDFSGVGVPKSNGQLYTLSYEQFVVPLVKAVQEQQAMIKKQQEQIDLLIKRLEILEKNKQ